MFSVLNCVPGTMLFRQHLQLYKGIHTAEEFLVANIKV